MEILNEDVIEFYLNKKTHYPMSDLFMMNYRNENQAYIGLYDVFNKTKEGKEGDTLIYEEVEKVLFDASKSDSRLKWLNELEKEEVLCQYKSLELEPNQKWHLLIAWYAYKIIMDIKNIQIEDASPALEANQKVKKWLTGTGKYCPELCLWMFEAAYDDDIIKREDIEEMYVEAVQYKKRSINKFSDVYWKKILSVIERDKNKRL